MFPPSKLKRLGAIAPRLIFEAFFASVTLYSARPAFASLHLPLQDLPQHMAAISVLKRYAFEPGLREYFELTLSRTQYLLVYAMGVLLAAPFGVEYAARLLTALTVVALPYALRFALRRTGGDERHAALVWPFAWNPQMLLGFLNFLLGIPLALVAIGLFAERDARADRRRQAILAVLAIATFYSHLIPFGLLGLGVLLLLGDGAWGVRAALALVAVLLTASRAIDVRMLVAALLALGLDAAITARTPWPRSAGAWQSLRASARAGASRLVRELAFLVPALIAAIVWVLRSPARDASVRAGGVGAQHLAPSWPQLATLPDQFRQTVLSHQGEADDRALIAWGLCLLAVLAASRRLAARPAAAARIVDNTAVAWLPFACAALYIASPESYGWIWPIHTRFAVAAVLVLPLAFARVRSNAVSWLVLVTMAAATVLVTNDLVENFKRWDREELGDLDAALAHARPGRRLVALVPPQRSEYVPGNVPTLHAAAYYQVRGGHVATFSFADFPQSPFRYRESGPRPPRLRPRWEWETSLRDADPDLNYYDYVLVRIGGNDEPASRPDAFALRYAGAEWRLYERRR